MKLIRVLWYGLFIDYHTKKQYTIDTKHKTVLNYHFEMAQHYYKKAYGKEWESSK